MRPDPDERPATKSVGDWECVPGKPSLACHLDLALRVLLRSDVASDRGGGQIGADSAEGAWVLPFLRPLQLRYHEYAIERGQGRRTAAKMRRLLCCDALVRPEHLHPRGGQCNFISAQGREGVAETQTGRIAAQSGMRCSNSELQKCHWWYQNGCQGSGRGGGHR